MQIFQPISFSEKIKQIDERLERGVVIMKQEVSMMSQHVRDMEARIEKLELKLKPS